MATLVTDFIDTFLHYGSGVVTQKGWSGGGIVADTINPGPFYNTSGGFGERVFSTTSGNRTHDFTTIGTIAYAAVKMRTTTAAGATILTLISSNAGSTTACSIRTTGATQIEMRTGTPGVSGTQIGVTAGGNKIFNDVYFVLEVALRLVSGASICEVRLNGLRLPELTTAPGSGGFGASGIQPAGTMAAITQFTSSNMADIGRISLGGNIFAGWVVMKTGSSLWTTLDTVSPPTTYAEQSDFVGDAKRAWLIPGAGGTHGLVNWGNGNGTYPASVADAATGQDSTTANYPSATGGMDSDSGYIVNTTAPTAVNADKVSHPLSNLPAAATRVRAVQRFINAKAVGTGSCQLKTFTINQALTETEDAGTFDLVDQNYRYRWITHDTEPATAALWTPTKVNALEVGAKLHSITP